MSGIIRQLEQGDERPGRRLRIDLHEITEAEIADGYKWLASASFDGIAVAERFVDGLATFIEEEANLQGTIPFDRRPDPESPSKRIWYRLSYRTSKRAAPWYVFFELLDEDSDGMIDTLYVVRVRHSGQGGTR